MLMIRLSRIGRKGEAKYRVVVKEKRSKRGGAAKDVVGYYEKGVGKSTKDIDLKKISYWKSKGAQLSPAVEKIISE